MPEPESSREQQGSTNPLRCALDLAKEARDLDTEDKKKAFLNALPDRLKSYSGSQLEGMKMKWKDIADSYGDEDPIFDRMVNTIDAMLRERREAHELEKKKARERRTKLLGDELAAIVEKYEALPALLANPDLFFEEVNFDLLPYSERVAMRGEIAAREKSVVNRYFDVLQWYLSYKKEQKQEVSDTVLSQLPETYVNALNAMSAYKNGVGGEGKRLWDVLSQWRDHSEVKALENELQKAMEKCKLEGAEN